MCVVCVCVVEVEWERTVWLEAVVGGWVWMVWRVRMLWAGMEVGDVVQSVPGSTVSSLTGAVEGEGSDLVL